MPEKALLIVDVQNDFCPGGSLAVPNGDSVVEPLNSEIKKFLAEGNPIFASRDWHPAETNHFKDFGGIWPVHCVRGTAGAEFHPDLKLPNSVIIISKGMAKDEDAFSAFQGIAGGTSEWDALNEWNSKTLKDILTELGVKEIYVGGLATDYCVKATVLDAIKYGFKVKLLIDACMGVNLKENDSFDAIVEMMKSGAVISVAGNRIGFGSTDLNRVEGQ